MTPPADASENPQIDTGKSVRPHPTDWALRSPLAIVLFVLIAAAGLFADLASKHYVFESMLSDPQLMQRAEGFRDRYQHVTTREVLHQFRKPAFWRVKFTLSTNPGVVFGLSMPRWAVAIATVATVILVGLFFSISHRRAFSAHIALALILAGALGNLYDRMYSVVAPLGMEPIRRNVRDFIDCSELHYPWIFNIADVWLVIGVSVLAIYWMIDAKRQSRAKKHISQDAESK